MGLDIEVYGDLKCITSFESMDDYEESEMYSDNLLYIYSHYFDKNTYNYMDGIDLVPGGVYSYALQSHFRAGSYSGYNHWRNRLSELMLGVPASTVWAAPETYRSKPFFYLICFSDCEGLIGGDAASKLHDDFMARQQLVDSLPDVLENENLVRVYKEFRKAFEIASNNGLVVFG